MNISKKSEQVKNTIDEVFSGVLVIKMSSAFLYIHEKIDTVITAHKKVLLKYIKQSVINSHLFTSLFNICSVKYLLKNGVLYKSEDRL